MITSEAASLTLSIAQGLIKLGGRVDRLMAEKEAITGNYILPMPPVRSGPGGIEMVQDIKTLLAETRDKTPDPLEPHRTKIEELLEQDTPDPKKVSEWYKRFFPHRAKYALINPDDEYLKELKRRFPSLDLNDESTLYAAFSIAAGRDEREIGYPWRVALTVVDVLAEFGADNTAMIVHDDKIRPVVRSLLERFSEPDLELYSMWSPLLRHALSSTLNGVLDSREAWQGESEWITAMFDALVSARETGGDDYLLGLIQGKGYRLLISEGLSEAATLLNDEDAGSFERIMGDVLKEAAPLVKTHTRGFGPFFQDHWGDLFRAGLQSLEKQGPTILKGESPLLRETLLAMVRELAKTSSAELLSSETVFHLADAAIAAVAEKPELITGDIGEPWLKLLITSVTETIGYQGIRRSFRKEGIEIIVNETLADFAEHPELIIEEPGLLQEITGSVLKKLGGVHRCEAETIATAAVEGALRAVSENPALLGTRYAEMIADFTGKVGEHVAAKTLTGIQASRIVSAATGAIMGNTVLFMEYENKVAETVLDTVLKAAEKDEMNMLYGTVLVSVVDGLFHTVARHGRTLIGNGTLDQLADRLLDILSAGLACAKEQLGRNLDVPSLPAVLSELVAWVAQEKGVLVDPKDNGFKNHFSALAGGAATWRPK
jgi:hypothetical protein